MSPNSGRIVHFLVHFQNLRFHRSDIVIVLCPIVLCHPHFPKLRKYIFVIYLLLTIYAAVFLLVLFSCLQYRTSILSAVIFLFFLLKRFRYIYIYLYIYKHRATFNSYHSFSIRSSKRT